MSSFALSRLSFVRAVTVVCAVVAVIATLRTASAASGPFALFPGSWDGVGKIQIGSKSERIRCKANYSLQNNNERDIVLTLICASDSYKFDLSGNFQADDSNKISGNWSERSRGVGGTASGVAQGDRFQLHVDSSAFSGNLIMITRGSSQTVNIDTIGTEDKISALITLKRGSR